MTHPLLDVSLAQPLAGSATWFGRVRRAGRRAMWCAALTIVACSLSACVTINIYFPAAAAEKAADKIIDEVWQLKPERSAPAPEKAP